MLTSHNIWHGTARSHQSINQSVNQYRAQKHQSC